MLLTLYAALLVGMVGLIGFGYWLGANTRPKSVVGETSDTDPRGERR